MALQHNHALQALRSTIQQSEAEAITAILRPVRIRPYYDRSDLVRVTTDTVEGNLLRGMILVVVAGLLYF